MLFRSGDDQFWLVGRVAISKMAGDGTIVFEDNNETIPGTGDVFIIENRPTTLRYLEFAPITKFPLAITSTSTNMAYLWYGALMVVFPKRIAKLSNVLYNSSAKSIPASVID